MSINIFNKRHPAIAEVFSSANSSKKILLVPIDYAKTTHKVLFINGDGDQCHAPFDIHYTADGFNFLRDAIKRACKKRRIPAKHEQRPIRSSSGGHPVGTARPSITP
ncbi:MAG: hypothetical protein AAF514_22945 [Verrucomicrobiota bacterium]